MDLQRKKYIAAIDKRLTTITPQQQAALRERGVETWGEYIVDVAEENGLKVGTAYAMFQALGESEAFDAFVTSCEDEAFMFDGE